MPGTIPSGVAGTFVQLSFTHGAASCAELAAGLRAFAAGRMTFRHVMRLEANQAVLGQSPVEWQEAGVTPADLGLESGEWYLDDVEASTAEELTLEQALERWPIGAWVGLCVRYDLPPGADGFPAVHGACAWRIWLAPDGAWRLTGAIEYPVSSVRQDPRWEAWLAAFIADAERAFDATCRRA